MFKSDIVIIGAGPIGMACGIAAKKAGLTSVIIDKGTLVNSLYNYPLNMTFFSTSDKLEIGDVPFISHNPKPTRNEALEYYRRVALHWNLDIRLYEKVLTVEKSSQKFIIQTTKNIIETCSVIIATGFYDIPNQMYIPGENLPKVHHYYKEAHPYFGQKIVVVGAANSAVDVALETYRKGAKVTMVIREPAIQENVKYWVKPDIENRIKENEIKAFLNSKLLEISDNHVVIDTPDGIVTLENDYVLAMTGYMPDFTFLESIGIELAKDEMKKPTYDPHTMQTNVPGIYLAGVICGGYQTNKWFIENSRIHADLIISHITLAKGKSD